MLDTLTGKWYLHYTNFGMWHHEDVYNVTFNYTPGVKNGKSILLDEVIYNQNGREQKITGFDTPPNPQANEFVWRGKGLLFFVSCPWKIEWRNEQNNCILLSFEKTLFTKAGFDIICRDKFAGPAITAPALEEINKNHNLKGKPLFAVGRQ